MGAITEISDTYDYTYIRSARDFVTRKWHKFPVENREDWEQMKWRFDPKDPKRFPADFEERCAQLRDRDYPFTIHFNGPFWQLREFCGMEGLCMMMLEQPDLVHEMAEFWMEFASAAMALDFCAPCYRRWFAEARAAGHLVAKLPRLRARTRENHRLAVGLRKPGPFPI